MVGAGSLGPAGRGLHQRGTVSPRDPSRGAPRVTLGRTLWSRDKGPQEEGPQLPARLSQDRPRCLFHLASARLQAPASHSPPSGGSITLSAVQGQRSNRACCPDAPVCSRCYHSPGVVPSWIRQHKCAGVPFAFFISLFCFVTV